MALAEQEGRVHSRTAEIEGNGSLRLDPENLVPGRLRGRCQGDGRRRETEAISKDLPILLCSSESDSLRLRSFAPGSCGSSGLLDGPPSVWRNDLPHNEIRVVARQIDH